MPREPSVKITTRFVSIWKLYGFIGTADDWSEFTLGTSGDPAAIALVTDQPELYFHHLDTHRALIALSWTGGLAPPITSIPERLAAKIDEIKQQRREETRNGIFLVIHGEASVPFMHTHGMLDTERFAYGSDLVDTIEACRLFDPFVTRSLVALSMSVSSRSDARVKALGKGIHLFDRQANKPIYSSTNHLGKPSFSFPTKADPESLLHASRFTAALGSLEELSGIMVLLREALDSDADPLFGFVCAWSALEMFLEKVVKTYPKLPAEEFGRDHLAKDFSCIARLLDPAAAVDDLALFKSIKDVRNDLYHRGRFPTEFPTEDVRYLLAKYLRLHISN